MVDASSTSTSSKDSPSSEDSLASLACFSKAPPQAALASPHPPSSIAFSLEVLTCPQYKRGHALLPTLQISILHAVKVSVSHNTPAMAHKADISHGSEAPGPQDVWGPLPMSLLITVLAHCIPLVL